MSKDDKKIIKLVLYILLFGAFCKVGFDIHTYLSIYDAMDTAKELLLLGILAIIILIAFCFIAVSVMKSYEKKKDIENTKNKIRKLENKMSSTSNKKRNNQR